MSDIHILEGNFNEVNGSGSIRVIYHVPHDNATSGYPGGQISILDKPSQAEITALNNGTLVEVERNVRLNHNKSSAQTKTKIRQLWAVIMNEIQIDYNNNYELYGQTLARL